MSCRFHHNLVVGENSAKGKGMPSKGKGGGKKSDEGSCGGYGPLYPTKDSVTGLYLLELPEGFTYSSYGWTGQVRR